MSRKTFSQVLSEAAINIPMEYSRLVVLFCKKDYYNSSRNQVSLRDLCAENFYYMPFRGTCISLSDFDTTHGMKFSTDANYLRQMAPDSALDYLVSFCEYSYNLAFYCQSFSTPILAQNALLPMKNAMQLYVEQVDAVIEKIGYMPNLNKHGITDFIPKDQIAISVAELVDPELSYRVIEYNHHSMKGDLERKRSTILVLSDKLEAQQKKLKQINASLETDLFFLLNNINLRHNNTDPAGGKKYHSAIAEMGKEELESWYDETYQMCLLAFLELENIDRKEKVGQLKQSIQS